MSNTEVQIPDGMMAAVDEAIGKARYEHPNLLNADGELRPTLFKFVILGAALRWLSENPVLPTAEQLYSTIGKLPVAMCDIVWTERDRAMIAEWQRRMFLAPNPQPVSDERLHQLAHDPFMCNITDEVVQCLRELEEFRSREAK